VLFLIVVFAMLWYLLGVSDERPVPNLGVTMLGIMYIGMLGSFAALLLTFPDGIGLLIAPIVAAVGYDLGAFLVGRSAGRSPLSDASPNKTVEGLVGGCIAAIAATVAIIGIGGVEPWGDGAGSLSDTIILGIVAAVAAPLGDLCESLLKRDLGVKDMGTILPGHGGLLDRFDSLLFVLPASYCTALVLDII
jgi:phosphatidate cytidylyltransferase